MWWTKSDDNYKICGLSLRGNVPNHTRCSMVVECRAGSFLNAGNNNIYVITRGEQTISKKLDLHAAIILYCY